MKTAKIGRRFPSETFFAITGTSGPVCAGAVREKTEARWQA